MPKIFIISCLVAASYAFSQPNLHQEWNSFKLEHGKGYGDQLEERMRLGIYLKNKAMIEQHNDKYKKGLVTFKMKMNQFGDLTDEEYSSMVLSSNLTMPGELLSGLVHNLTSEEPPLAGAAYVNWYDRGAVTPIKNQGLCGSCWAFSVAGALESHNKIWKGKLVELSEQNLLDCSTNGRYKNRGCLGGWMAPTFQYVIDSGGIDTEISYPYTGILGRCKFDRNTVGGSCRGFVRVDKSESALRQVIERWGPVSVAIDALRPTFKFYAGGVYYDASCGMSLNPLNHAVLAIGFGEEFFNPYWILKNSWGTSWGEKGFLKLARNRGNHCGITSAAVFPLV